MVLPRWQVSAATPWLRRHSFCHATNSSYPRYATSCFRSAHSIAGMLVAEARVSDGVGIKPVTGEHPASYRTLLEAPVGELRGIAATGTVVHFGCWHRITSRSITRSHSSRRAGATALHSMAAAAADASRIRTHSSSLSGIASSRNTRRSHRLRRCSLGAPSAVSRRTRRASDRSSTACQPVSQHSVAAHLHVDRVRGGARVDPPR